MLTRNLPLYVCVWAFMFFNMDNLLFLQSHRPGMNRCNVPEEVTTNTLRALYQPAASVPAPASESQHVQLNNSDVTSAGVTSVDARYPGQEHQNVSVQNAIASGKKKYGPTADLDGSAHSSNSQKKGLGTSGKISGNKSPSPDASAYQHLRQSSIADEKYNDTRKEQISVVYCSDKGISLSTPRFSLMHKPSSHMHVKSSINSNF